MRLDIINKRIKEVITNNGNSLNLCGLGLTEVPNEVFELTTLETLYLDWNDITIIPENISKLTNLKTLDLGENNIVSLPNSITNMPYIKLYLRGKQVIGLTNELLFKLSGRLFILDKHNITPYSITDIRIGCKTDSLYGWIENGLQVAQKFCYTKNEIANTRHILLQLKELFTH